MQYPFTWCPGYENSLMGKTLYFSLLFQWSKNVQVTFLVCPSNVVDFWGVVNVTEFNILTTRFLPPPLPPLDNRELASFYRKFQCVHYLTRNTQFIVWYLFPPSILIALIIFTTIINALVSFYLHFQCAYNLHHEKLCFFCWVLLKTRLKRAFSSGIL